MNGEPGVVGLQAGRVVAAIAFTTRNGTIHHIRAVLNPATLAHLTPPHGA